MKKAVLFKGKEKSLERKHPWLFSGAIQNKDKDLQEGDAVEVYSASGDFLCVGHWQNETIAVKILSFQKENIDFDFFNKRIALAVNYRKTLGLFNDKTTTILRLINAEGDNLPGLIADWYEGNVVLQFHSVGMYLMKELIVKALIDNIPQIKSIFSKSSSTLGRNKNVQAKDEFLLNPVSDEYFKAKENDCLFLIDYREGQKTGFFIDQKDNRKLLSLLSKDKKVLNCFSYPGGFSVAALQGGAALVESVDISKKACEICNENAVINSLEKNHRIVCNDVLQYLDEVPKDEYDIIILDPPAFAKHNRDLKQGLKGYRQINVKAMDKIKKGGLLFTFSCSQAVSPDDFFTMLFSCAVISGRNVRIIKRLVHNTDHPQSIFHPEGEYLKGALLYIE
ncbi:MAG: class I SAM-dependent rRNA methyltransferase [Bacteroidales bacterium]|nr:class I SAM-dependent rRNA methyltransferase [Bacteroidales bacterium]